MVKEIAVLVNQQQVTTGINEPGMLIVYVKENTVWSPVRQMVVSFDYTQGLAGLREKVAELVVFLQQCKIFIALAVQGVPYFELEKAQINVWEVEGKPEAFLDEVWERERELAAQKIMVAKPSVESFIEETSCGHYFVDLIKVQQNNTGVSSKQVLLPLLRKGKFETIGIQCKHIPLWLEAELMGKKLDYAVEPINTNEVKVNISNRCCS